MARKSECRQRTLATAGFDVMRKSTRRHEFLRMMHKVMPWAALAEIVEPCYPQSEGPGRPAKPLIWMLKLYFLQVWYALSDPQTEELMHDSPAVQEFLGLDLGQDAPPDETTILRFRHLIEEHGLGPRLLETVNRHLAEQGIQVRGGTILAATVIRAPTFTKNAAKSRDAELGSTKQGNRWEFGAKLHVGVDGQTKVIHSLSMTAANVHDSRQVAELLHGEERRVYGDKAYAGQKEAIRERAPQARDFTERRGHGLSAKERASNRWKSRVRARVEHVFGVIKHRFGWRKVRFRGMWKNLQYAYGVAAAVNVYLHRRTLLGGMACFGTG